LHRFISMRWEQCRSDNKSGCCNSRKDTGNSNNGKSIGNDGKSSNNGKNSVHNGKGSGFRRESEQNNNSVLAFHVGSKWRYAQ